MLKHISKLTAGGGLRRPNSFFKFSFSTVKFFFVYILFNINAISIIKTQSYAKVITNIIKFFAKKNSKQRKINSKIKKTFKELFNPSIALAFKIDFSVFSQKKKKFNYILNCNICHL